MTAPASKGEDQEGVGLAKLPAFKAPPSKGGPEEAVGHEGWVRKLMRANAL